MKAKFASMLAGLVFAAANLLAQDAQIVADNLAYSRGFYAEVHFQAIAAQPNSFAYDRYPDNGAERIRCNVGAFAHQHPGQPWLKSDDWGHTGLPVDKETLKCWKAGLS